MYSGMTLSPIPSLLAVDRASSASFLLDLSFRLVLAARTEMQMRWSVMELLLELLLRGGSLVLESYILPCLLSLAPSITLGSFLFLAKSEHVHKQFDDHGGPFESCPWIAGPEMMTEIST